MKCATPHQIGKAKLAQSYQVSTRHLSSYTSLGHLKKGWQWGGVGPKDGVFALASHEFFLPHPRPAPHDRENFLPHLCPLRPCAAPFHPVKLYFLLIFPTTITIFLNKMTCFNNKNILEIINKFILSNQTNF